MSQVKVSVVIPVYNVEEYLDEALECIEKQTLSDIEIICVDDGSTDSSLDVLKRHAAVDSRICVITQENKGAGVARNLGFTKTAGEYVIFLDGDDLFSDKLLESLYNTANEYQADIVACNYSQFDTKGNIIPRKGIHTEWLPQNKVVFNYQDCPDYIMSVVNSTPWNKLYRSEFIQINHLKFEEITSSNDITFASVSVAMAERVAYVTESLLEYRIGHEGTITSTKSKNLHNVITAVTSAVKQVKALSYSEEIKNSILRFAVDNYTMYP